MLTRLRRRGRGSSLPISLAIVSVTRLRSQRTARTGARSPLLRRPRLISRSSLRCSSSRKPTSSACSLAGSLDGADDDLARRCCASASSSRPRPAVGESKCSMIQSRARRSTSDERCSSVSRARYSRPRSPLETHIARNLRSAALPASGGSALADAGLRRRRCRRAGVREAVRAGAPRGRAGPPHGGPARRARRRARCPRAPARSSATSRSLAAAELMSAPSITLSPETPRTESRPPLWS